MSCECGCGSIVRRIFKNGWADYCFDCLILLKSELDGVLRVESNE